MITIAYIYYGIIILCGIIGFGLILDVLIEMYRDKKYGMTWNIDLGHKERNLYGSIVEQKLYEMKYKYRRKYSFLSNLFCEHSFKNNQCKKCLRIKL